MKKLIRLGLLLVVLVVLAVVAIVFYIDSIARAGIERGATSALGVTTTLGAADVEILAGRFSMRDLRVANPDGFDTPHFLALREGGVAVDLGTLRGDLVELPTLELAGVDVNLEQRADGANYRVILDHVQRRESGDAPVEDDHAEGKRFVIRQIAIRDVNVHVDLLPGIRAISRVDVPIKEIVLHDVGSESSGVMLAEITSVLIKAIIEAAVSAGGGLIPEDILGDLRSQLAQLDSIGDLGLEVVGGEAIGKISEELGKSVDDLGGRLGEGLGKGLGDAAESAGGEAEKVLQGLGGLLGGKKKNDGD